MTRGTTRQILADLAATRSSTSRVHISRSPDAQMVQITVACQPNLKAGAIKTISGFAVMLGIVLVLGVITRIPQASFIFAWMLIGCAVAMVVSYDRAARAYVFRIGRDKAVVASSGPFGPRYWEIDSATVRDVRLKEGRCRYILFDVAGGFGKRKGFVLELHREEFMQLIDAVREGLGMPKREGN